MTASSALQHVDARVREAAETAQLLERLRALELQPAVRAGRNLYDNGQAAIAQRAPIAGVASGTWVPDRWVHFRSATSVWTQGQSFDRPAGEPFIGSVNVECTTASAPTAAQWTILRQGIEGVRCWPLQFGTARALPLVKSFWVKSNRPGIYNAELVADGNGQSSRISRAYTIDVADRWERKVLAFPANQLNVIDYATSAQLSMHLWLQAGSDFTSGGSRNEEWVTVAGANNNKRAYQQTNLGATVGGYIRFAGLQLEPGVNATPFEQLLYHHELRQAHRYLQSWTEPPLRGVVSTGANVSRLGMPLPTPMRATPAVSATGTLWVHDGIDVRFITSITTNYSDSSTVEIDGVVNAAWSVSGRACGVYQNGAGTMWLAAEI